ncbi:unnamed protein product [Plutella xylostella]|uniref:(diamondback moth) hypothetical protein n=1 Tax=Plutella xylostella TaxID=51655 RepID=A0A8S4G7X0_PLUXY|nr:unnamed protein product [Plutella xylostella]
MLFLVVLVVLVLLISVKVYQKLTCGMCRSSAHMVGKTVIVTGGNCGLGLEVARDLAQRGARVILACRSVRRGAAARDQLARETGGDVQLRQLDLASLRSVREFAAHILATEPRLDVLINNAGAGGLGNSTTADDLHIGMQVNYFGPFLLTCLLAPLLKKSAPSRIVNVSSMIHKYGEMDFENLNMEKYWSDHLVYANSKLFLNLMTLELSKRLEGTGVTVNALHPGMASTNIFRRIPSTIIRTMVEFGIGFLFQTPREAAQTTLHLAVSPAVAGITGRYFADCREARPSKMSLNEEAAKRLFSESERLVKYTLPKL